MFPTVDARLSTSVTKIGKGTLENTIKGLKKEQSMAGQMVSGLVMLWYIRYDKRISETEHQMYEIKHLYK